MPTTHWTQQLPIAITVSDTNGVILEMNERSIATFANDGGEKLIGSNLYDCHPEHSHPKLDALYNGQNSNHYTISKNGQKKMIHQIPWYEDGKFAGIVEISIPIPDKLPHFDRD